ncbi:Disease resistance protein [Melia azedarach]|uniref:Disease resistance protein n=1 Tax=Melia azedarach TaxID=155640 RepID=A0ACC1YLB4_MELAZ|nr:Disease resistance protein [Melia azedarach]
MGSNDIHGQLHLIGRGFQPSCSGFYTIFLRQKAAARAVKPINNPASIRHRTSSRAPIHSCRSEPIQSRLGSMVDAVVSYVVQRLGDYLIQEAVFLAEVKNEVIWLKKELEWMLCFIKDAEQKEVGYPLIRQWLSDIRDIAYDTEDVLDKYMPRVNDGETSDSLIVDAEGLGKTTLARKLYHHVDVKDKFDYCGWVSVSQDYRPKDILMRIIKSFDFITATDKLETEEDMERCLHKSLQGYSYLLVVDDLWHKEDWESLKRAFPNNKNGSRVIITTRIKEVTERSDGKTYLHELQFLKPDDSWRLFCEKAFRNTNGNSKVLEILGREVVQKCGGLPLAIVVLGGLLSTKKPQEGRMVRDHIWRHLRSDSIQISYLLDLSFNDLSHELKLCFLYLSLFPEDYEINVEKLIRLLVAEGFISQNENQIMEEVAKEKLDELINRSLIQVEKRCWGRIATCKLHDLLRDLAIQKARELNFIHICDETTNLSRSSEISSCRRQAFYSDTACRLCLQHANSLSRSLLLFNQEWSYSVFMLLFARFSLLRVFDFQAAFNIETRISSKDHVDGDIGKLIHLKYLGLKNSFTTILPPSIVKLHRLETLDLSGLFQLPTEISELQELRHLIGRFIGPLPIENLTNLQTLKYVELESWSKLNTDKLVNLRELHIEENNETEGKKLFTFDSISKLKNLRFLSVKRSYSKSFASLQPLSHCSYLVDLRLRGRMKRLPEDMHALLPNVECFSLEVPYVEEDPLLTLEKLLHLTILYLKFNCRYVKKLVCTAESFPGLEILELDAGELEEWQVEEGAMPMLRGLRIPEIPGLQIPERLRQMPPPALWEFEEQNGRAVWLF